MSEENRDYFILADHFDARLLSLYSRRVQDGLPRGFLGPDRSYSFCYYDAIEVEPVVLKDGPVLKDAYTQAQRKCNSSPTVGEAQNLGFHQTLVALTDLKEKPGGHGYTREEIEDFWSSGQSAPLFFVSMLSLAATEDLDSVLSEIRDKFPSGRHLAYITFDHCDIIIFCRGHSFQEYARCIFDLYYAGKTGLGDAITLYSFTNDGITDTDNEHFAALVRLGVKDYPSREKFYQKLQQFSRQDSPQENLQEDEQLRKYWLLERNDIAFYREDATLSWLSKVRQAVSDVEEQHGAPWYNTYSLTVLIPDGTEEDSKKWCSYKSPNPNKVVAHLQQHMNALFEKFKDSYEAAHHHLQQQGIKVHSDQVLLRWVEESCSLAVSLMSNRLSENLGVCLLPQFEDMLTYSQLLFSQKEHITRDDVEHIQRSFNEFFSNVAVLIDSMNQTNRRFVQVPSFHLTSFEIPPQIMAYYTVIVRKMLDVLKDRETDNFYGLTMSPRLVNTLSVFSLGVPELLPKDEWISMNMDESSFYTLRLTVETLAHEVSHFVGEELRKRELRKECMIKCVFQILVNALMILFTRHVDQLAMPLCKDQLPANVVLLRVDELDQAAQALWEQSKGIDSDWYGCKNFHHSWHMGSLVWQIPQDVRNDPALGHEMIRQIRELVRKTNTPGSRALLERLRMYVEWKLGLDGREDAKCPSSDAMFNEEKDILVAAVDNEAEELLSNVVDDLANDLQDFYEASQSIRETSTEGASEVDSEENGDILNMVCRELDYLCYMFRETFADLQAIILLNMDWKDYCNLLLQGNDTPGDDHAPRMFAVTKALIDCGLWSYEGIDYEDTVFANVSGALSLDPVNNADRLSDTHRISPTLSFYLITYLSACAQDIRKFFTGPSKETVQELQDIHAILSNQTTFLDLQKNILNLTNGCRTSLLEASAL